MITNFFIPELNNHDVQELWFQQDGATCHTARATIDLLKTRLSLVYADKPQTLDHLEDNIRRVIADIRPQMLEKVIENWTSRLDYIRASRGSPMPEIIFKIRYGGYGPMLFIEWAQVRIPNEAWMYLREKKSEFHRVYIERHGVIRKWILVPNGKLRTPSVLCWDHR
ncbi:putative transposable element [Trichonephila clavipes]|nr:putative transposable element [Trichonephila clavipes]